MDLPESKQVLEKTKYWQNVFTSALYTYQNCICSDNCMLKTCAVLTKNAVFSLWNMKTGYCVENINLKMCVIWLMIGFYCYYVVVCVEINFLQWWEGLSAKKLQLATSWQQNACFTHISCWSQLSPASCNPSRHYTHRATGTRPTRLST